MTYADAYRVMRKIGCAHAAGDTYRAMHAKILADNMRGAKPERFYEALEGKTDGEILAATKRLLNDPGAYTDVLLGEKA